MKMKGKNIFRVIAMTFVILFISIYLTQVSDYTEKENAKTTITTNNSIEGFEDDISNGNNLDEKSYTIKKKDYSNAISKAGMGLSKLVDKSFQGLIKLIFTEVEKQVNK